MTPQDNPQDVGAPASPSGSRPSDGANSSVVSTKGFDPASEGLCQLCHRGYRVWSASSPLWNAVTRNGCINGDEEYSFLCANCFMELAEDRGLGALFYVMADRVAKLQTVTPSGRVWNEAERRFVEP